MNKNSPRKILYVCTEDWFFYSHFRPLVKAANKISGLEILLATTAGQKTKQLEDLGVRILPVNIDRASTGLFSALRLFRQLMRIARSEKPDIVHFLALKPVLLGGMLRLFVPPFAAVYHVTGLGTLAEGDAIKKRLLRSLVFRLPGLYMRNRNSAILVENPDDAGYLQCYGLARDVPLTILGGAGIDPQNYPAQPDPDKPDITIAFVGRMIRTKGVDVLIAAMDHLNDCDPPVKLALYGQTDPANPGCYTQERLEEWNRRDDVAWHGFSVDIARIWKQADICVVPTVSREGMPRAMLEAASCQRPLIVTDVPGCRHFVRDGVEGLVVTPGNAAALAAAIARLAGDRDLRKKMGRAARQRVRQAYTEDHIVDDVLKVYKNLF